MIIEVVVRTCPECESEDIVRNGHDYKGAQKYHCHACGAYGTLDKKTMTLTEPSSRPSIPTLKG